MKAPLVHVSVQSGAETMFDNTAFYIAGSDEAVKLALSVLAGMPMVAQSQGHIKAKVELANEHKEFVSGKKNGKINKIMGQGRHVSRQPAKSRILTTNRGVPPF